MRESRHGSEGSSRTLRTVEAIARVEAIPSNKKLLGTSASLLVTSAIPTSNKKLLVAICYY